MIDLYPNQMDKKAKMAAIIVNAYNNNPLVGAAALFVVSVLAVLLLVVLSAA